LPVLFGAENKSDKKTQRSQNKHDKPNAVFSTPEKKVVHESYQESQTNIGQPDTFLIKGTFFSKHKLTLNRD
jgi:hypothetical protein